MVKDMKSIIMAISMLVLLFMCTGLIGANERWHRFDFNHDKRIDSADLAIFAEYYGYERGDSRYIGRFDANHDGIIDMLDAHIIAVSN